MSCACVFLNHFYCGIPIKAMKMFELVNFDEKVVLMSFDENVFIGELL